MGRWRGAAAAAAVVAATGGMALAQSAPFTNPFGGLFGRGGAASSIVDLQFRIAGDDDGLERRLRNASLLRAALDDGRSSGQDVLAAARADYARLLGNLYDFGYFSASIDITLDGVEAATVAPLDAPEVVRQVIVSVDPGDRFRFSRAQIAPVAPETELPDDYRAGAVAGTGTIRDAARAGVGGWRDHGHAKADVAGTDIIADHPARLLDARIALAPGPVVRFGQLRVQGLERLREERLREMAGFPEGDVFNPETLDAIRRRLRRSGVFTAITLDEAETLGPGNSMDIDLTVVEQRPRQIGGGFEVSTDDGAAISGYWMHRNLWGGAERLRIAAQVSDIGSDSSGQDYELTTRLERPATFGRDFTAFVEAGVARMREVDHDSDSAFIGFGADYYRNDNLSGSASLQYRKARVTDDNGTTDFTLLAMPLSGIWDRRDVEVDAKRGFWLRAGVTPFVGLEDSTGSGARAELEGRAYRSFGEGDRLTFAGRARLGTVTGPEIAETPRDYLFYSGGGGSVRGQPFESLGVEVIPGPDGPIKTGGMSVANITAEVRFQARERIGLAAFADAGKVWAEGGFQGENDWHAGAGLGVRYLTPIGPIRLDVAGPVGGDTGEGVQVYLGLGQAF